MRPIVVRPDPRIEGGWERDPIAERANREVEGLHTNDWIL